MMSPTVLASARNLFVNNQLPHPWTNGRFQVFCFVLSLTLFRLVYTFFWSPYDLAPDEAHYWDWSRHLDWSYYSKGPLVAWLIRLSVELFGSLSLSIHGSLTAAVRVPAVMCGGLFLWGLYSLAHRTLKSEKHARFAVFVASTIPAMNAFSLLMTIDAPYLTCWVWALVYGHDAVVENRRIQWFLTGIVVALGILAKYTMAVWLGSFALYLLVNPQNRHKLFTLNFGLMVAVASLSALPILIWNSSHDWVTFRHVAGQAGVGNQTSNGIRWMGPILFLSSQLAVLLGYWLIIGAWAFWRNRPSQLTDEPINYLWWMSFPTIVLFSLLSLKTPIQLNWPAGAYVGGFLLAFQLIEQEWSKHQRWFRFTTIVFVGLGTLGTLVLHQTSIITRLIVSVVPEDSVEKPTRLRQFDPAARLKGWRYLASQIDQIRVELKSSGQDDPILAGLRWDLPGELGIYCEANPTVYSLGLAMGDRHSQYDWWRPNPLTDAQEFHGKTFVFVGVPGVEFALEEAFNQVEPPRVITKMDGDRAIAQWYVWVCRGYRGFETLQSQIPSRH